MNTRISRHFAALSLLFSLVLTAPAASAAGTKHFATPEAAMQAFADALMNQDEKAKRDLLGADYPRWIPPVGDDERYRFWSAWARSHTIRPDGDRRAWIAVGDKGWTLPIPLVKSAAGWQFDTRAGEQEIAVRRIGRNELGAIDVALSYVKAQNEYAALDPDGDGVRAYAQRFGSTPGKRDGLYWPTARGEPASPLGPLVAAAAAEGKDAPGTYHGYHYRILTAQGPAADGGVRNYLDGRRMTGGFALVAWPAEYRKSGVMTFIVSQQGAVYQRDLGPDTARRAKGIVAFDPVPGWTRTSDQ